MRFKRFISVFHRGESGQDMLEYALVLAAVMGAVVAGTDSLSDTVSKELPKINREVRNDVRKILYRVPSRRIGPEPAGIRPGSTIRLGGCCDRPAYFVAPVLHTPSHPPHRT